MARVVSECCWRYLWMERMECELRVWLGEKRQVREAVGDVF